jgi:acyl-ACP thioesterase
MPERLDHIGMEARLEYASEVAPGEEMTFVDGRDAPKAR